MTAMVDSNIVPPIDPHKILFASQRKVHTSSTNRMGTPCSMNTASVARHEAMTVSQPAAPRTRTTPAATLTPITSAATQSERVLNARNDRKAEMSELADAGKLPSSRKCAA